MAQWLPQSWRQALTRLRDDIHRALDRWLPRRRADQREKEAERWLPARWSASVEQLGTDIHKVLDSWWPRWRGREVDEEMWSPSLVSGRGPRIDLEETDDEVIVLAELPGLDKNDFTVEVTGDRLVLRGEKRQETEEQRQGYYYAERSYGAFARALTLPARSMRGRPPPNTKTGCCGLPYQKLPKLKPNGSRSRCGESAVYGHCRACESCSLCDQQESARWDGRVTTWC